MLCCCPVADRAALPRRMNANARTTLTNVTGILEVNLRPLDTHCMSAQTAFCSARHTAQGNECMQNLHSMPLAYKEGVSLSEL